MTMLLGGLTGTGAFSSGGAPAITAAVRARRLRFFLGEPLDQREVPVRHVLGNAGFEPGQELAGGERQMPVTVNANLDFRQLELAIGQWNCDEGARCNVACHGEIGRASCRERV